VSWLHCQEIAGLKYWVQLLFNFTPVSAECTPSVDRALSNVTPTIGKIKSFGRGGVANKKF